MRADQSTEEEREGERGGERERHNKITHPWPRRGLYPDASPAISAC